MAHSSDDPIIRSYRAQLSGLDLRILEALNQRVDLVKHLKDYKEAQGFGFHDAAQEERVVADLRQANRGPLSGEGLEAIFRLILEWTKRGAAGLGDVKPT